MIFLILFWMKLHNYLQALNTKKPLESYSVDSGFF